MERGQGLRAHATAQILTPPSPSRSPQLVLYVPDLMDRSRLEAARRSVGPGAGRLEFVRNPGDLAGAVAAARSDDPGADVVVVVDLGRPGVLEELGELAAGGAEVVGFASHVERDLLRRSKQAGCSRVLARSAFFGSLAELLS
jgi:hypothetical protein